MSRKWTYRSILPALLLALAIGSCEQPGALAPESADAPPASMLLDSDDDGEESTDGTVEGTDGEEYELVEEQIPDDIDDLTVSKLIDADGGQLSLAGHTLTVPEGAVDEPTLFTMTLVTSGYVEVDLSATIELLGEVIEVGTEDDPFLKPVTISLTYARSPNVEEEDEDDLINLRMLGDDHDDAHEPLESEVDKETKTVSSELDHFTGYCMAM